MIELVTQKVRCVGCGALIERQTRRVVYGVCPVCLDKIDARLFGNPKVREDVEAMR